MQLKIDDAAIEKLKKSEKELLIEKSERILEGVAYW